MATALAARTTTFQPLIAIRPGYWRPAPFAAAAAALDQLSGGRVLVNIVSGQDQPAAYGDSEGDQAQRYARTREFLRLVRRLWTEDEVTHDGEHFPVARSTLAQRAVVRGGRRHPTLYFGGASEAAERVAATEAKVARMTADLDPGRRKLWNAAVGRQRLLDLAARGDVLDDNLYTAPGRFGGGGAGTTWLVGSPADVATSLRRHQEPGITHFILSDTPYLPEIKRQGEQLLPLVRDQ